MFKKSIILCFAMIMVIPTLALAASSYNFEYEFKNYLWSRVYNINNGNSKVTISTNPKQIKGNGNSDLKVSLFYRPTFGADKHLGSKSYSLYSPDSGTWTGTPGNGQYIFILQKNNDGQVVYGTGSIK